MKILFAGTPQNAADTLRNLVSRDFNVVGVLTREDAETGRKRQLTESSVAQTAHELDLRTIKANRLDNSVLAQITELKADIGVIVAFGVLLGRDALAALPRGWVNLHYSLLPDWRGAAPAQRAILAGDAETGVTLFQLDEGLDTGPIWGQVATQIQPGENSSDLIARLTQLGNSLLFEKLPLIESGLSNPVGQIGTGRLARKLRRNEAKLDFARPAREIELAVRAFNPEPIAYTTAGPDLLRVIEAFALGATDSQSLRQMQIEPGALIFEPSRVLAQCGSGTLLQLNVVQPAGKKPMSASDWSRGTKVTKLG